MAGSLVDNYELCLAGTIVTPAVVLFVMYRVCVALQYIVLGSKRAA